MILVDRAGSAPWFHTKIVPYLNCTAEKSAGISAKFRWNIPCFEAMFSSIQLVYPLACKFLANFFGSRQTCLECTDALHKNDEQDVIGVRAPAARVQGRGASCLAVRELTSPPPAAVPLVKLFSAQISLKTAFPCPNCTHVFCSTQIHISNVEYPQWNLLSHLI